MKNTKKRILSGLLCLVMSLTLLPTAAIAAGRFTDVTEKDWFCADVEYAVEQGLVDGMTATTYSPNSNLTYAAAIKLAACMHKKVTQGNTDFTVGSPWYQVYVDYAQANGIISVGKTYDWNANATRAGYMEIFANAIPDSGLKNGYTELMAMNKVDDGAIPDVSMTHPQAAAIYKLYRAGILQGDETHKCSPDNYIRRSEVAAILTRMMDASKRISFEMKAPETSAPETSASAGGLTIAQQPADAAVAPGDKAQFTVAVSGGKGPYTYKWYSSADGASWTAIVNSSQYSGCATATLSVKADASTALRYRCEITDATHGSVTSNAAKLTVGASTLAVTQQPTDATVALGDKAQFTVAVSGGKGPYTYKWYVSTDGASWTAIVNSSQYSGCATATLSVKVDAFAGLRYRCEITDANHGSVTSDAAAVIEKSTAVATRPNATPSRPSTSTSTDSTATDSSSTPSRPTATVSGSTTDSSSTPSRPTATVSGSTTDSSTPSRPTATVSTSTDGLHITTQPVDASAAVNEKVSFTVEISGGKGPFTYQWQYSTDGGETWLPVANSTKYSGVSSATLTVKIDGTDNSGRIYRCKISDAAHTEVYSDSVTAHWVRPTVAG